MEYFCCVLRRHLIKKFKDVGANALFNSFFGGNQIYLHIVYFYRTSFILN